MMDPVYRYDMTILPSVCDRTARLSVPSTFAVFMDAATDHTDRLGVGADAMLARGLFWLTVKTKVRFFHRPRMMERVTVCTCPLVPEKFRSVREYAIEQDGQTLILGKTEWAVVEIATGRLQKMEGLFPAETPLGTEPWFAEPFARIAPDFSDAEPMGSYTVRSIDIDLGDHMNNAAYLRALYGLLSSKELKDFPQDELEICFRTPCYEGNELRFMRCPVPDGVELAACLPDGKPAVFIKAARK